VIVKSLGLRPRARLSQRLCYKKEAADSVGAYCRLRLLLKRILNESSVGFSHVFTCFKDVGERVPDDLPQTCRNAASQKGWIDTATQDDLNITTRGENLVDHDLPKAGTPGYRGKVAVIFLFLIFANRQDIDENQR